MAGLRHELLLSLSIAIKIVLKQKNIAQQFVLTGNPTVFKNHLPGTGCTALSLLFRQGSRMHMINGAQE